MNEQAMLSEVDALRMANLQLRQQLVQKDAAIVALETRLFQQQVHATYGNPRELIEIMPDGALSRRPVE